MTPEERPTEDPVLARVAAARPALREADLSPESERAAAILERVLTAPGSHDQGALRRMWRRWSPRWPSGIAVVAGAVAVAAVVFVAVGLGGGAKPRASRLGSHPLPTADAVHLDDHAFIPRKQLRLLDRTPLGRAIAQQYLQIQEDIDTGSAAQNRRAIQQLQFNEAACRHAAAVVAAASASPAQRYIQYDWVHGIKQQAHLDGLFITALQELTTGHRAAGERAENAAADISNVSDLYTAYALNALSGDPGPLPRAPGIEGPRGTRRR